MSEERTETVDGEAMFPASLQNLKNWSRLWVIAEFSCNKFPFREFGKGHERTIFVGFMSLLGMVIFIRRGVSVVPHLHN